MSSNIFILADLAPYPGDIDYIAPPFPIVLLIIPLFVVGLSLVLSPLQYWIFKHPKSIVAKILAGLIYFVGVLVGILGLDGADELSYDYENNMAVRISLGLAFAILVTTLFLLTHQVSSGKKPNRAFWIKCLIAAVIAFIAIQVDISLSLVSINI